MKRHGFTLVELLAVIIILGLLMVMILPKVTGVYNDSKKNIAHDSVNNLVKAFDEYYVRMRIKDNFNGCNYSFSNGINDCDGFDFDGKRPVEGNIQLSSDGLVNGHVKFYDYIYEVINGEVNDFQPLISDGKQYVFDYTGGDQSITIEQFGYYKIEAWGASGGDSRSNGIVTPNAGGFGGYTSGIIFLSKNQTLYVYVGGKGENAVVGKDSAGGYNGGGLGTWDNSDDESAGGGGGATDIRLVGGNWNDFESLKSRIMVAGGGGGQSWSYSVGYAGGLSGYSYYSDVSSPGTQTSGYKFGIGMDGYGVADSVGVGGGGSGYYGGNTSSVDYKPSGSGGSSFISGYVGCDAISGKSTENNIIHTGQSVHYSGLKFTDGIMKSGNEVMPTYDGTSTMAGNSDNGFVKITYLGLIN